MKKNNNKVRAPRNRTLFHNENETSMLKNRLIRLDRLVNENEIENKTICQDVFEALDYLPDRFVDLLFVDPPYNLSKEFNKVTFKEMMNHDYEAWLES